jgi:hypothetical protein
MASDRRTGWGGNVVALTQDYLSHMLGMRRASVTVAAGVLQKAGLIAYKRGAVTIGDRTLLEQGSCECYGVLTQQIQKWPRRMNVGLSDVLRTPSIHFPDADLRRLGHQL